MRKKASLLAVLLGALVSVGIFLVYATGDSVLLTGSFGDSHSTGSFSTGGNAGIISFDYIPLSASGAQVVGLSTSSQTVYLTGIFWSQTTGWATFSDVGVGPVSIIPPGTGSNIRDPWYLSGYAWSENAGWISLNHGESYTSGVLFLPDTTSLSGYAWNDNLGWIYFGSGSSTTGLDQGFIGKISIGGGLGGTKGFSVLYDIPGGFASATVGVFLNAVRKNVSVIIRNAGGKINTDLTLSTNSTPLNFNNTVIYRSENNPSSLYLRYGIINGAFSNITDKIRSLIIIGADIYIDTDIITPVGMTAPRAIIALKNEKGEGGNIYIGGTVKKIEASLVAEKTIWSGDNAPGNLSPYYVTKKSIFLDLPKNQLYIKGTTASYNTIGGSAKDGGAVCPVFTRNDEACTYDSAIPYDWNYFRAYDSTNPARRAYPNPSKDAYSTVIEYDPRILQDPPPGLETKK